MRGHALYLFFSVGARVVFASCSGLGLGPLNVFVDRIHLVCESLLKGVENEGLLIVQKGIFEDIETEILYGQITGVKLGSKREFEKI